MRRFPTGKGLVAMENEVPDGGTPAEGDLPVEAPAESVEADLVEINEDVADGDATEAKVDEAVDAVEALESIHIGLESFQAAGGLNEQGAFFMNLHLQHINSRMGVVGQPKISMEHFNAPSTKLKATSAALESVSDSLKAIWEAIKSAIKKSIEWVITTFNKYFGGAERLKKRAAALQATASKTTGTPKEKEIDNERLFQALQSSGKVDKVADEMGYVGAVAVEIYGPLTAVAMAGADAVTKALEAASTEGFTAKGLNVTPKGFSAVSDADAKSHGYGETVEGVEFKTPGELPGGKTVLLRGMKDGLSGEAAIKAYSNTGAQIVPFNSSAKVASGTKLKVLSTKEVEDIAKAVEETCDQMIAFKKKLFQLKDTKTALLKGVDKAEKASESDDKAKAEEGKKLAKLTQAVVSNMDKAAFGFSAYALNTSAQALQYGDLSLRQYGAK